VKRDEDHIPMPPGPRESASALVDGDAVANIKLLEDSGKNLLVIMKDGKIYKNQLSR
jgi:hypothetical protein